MINIKKDDLDDEETGAQKEEIYKKYVKRIRSEILTEEHREAKKKKK